MPRKADLQNTRPLPSLSSEPEISAPFSRSPPMPMRLYFVPNDPERTTLVSANGVAHYQVSTTRTHRLAPTILHIRRSGDSEADSFVADIDWKHFGAHPTVRTSVLDGMMEELQVRQLLYKLGKHFSP